MVKFVCDVMVSTFLAIGIAGCVSGGGQPDKDLVNISGWWVDDRSEKVVVQMSASGSFRYEDENGIMLGTGSVFRSGKAFLAPNGAGRHFDGRLLQTSDPQELRIEWKDGRIWSRSTPTVPPPPVAPKWDPGPEPSPQHVCNQIPGLPSDWRHTSTRSETVVPQNAVMLQAALIPVHLLRWVLQATSSEPADLESLFEGTHSHVQGLARLHGRWIISHSSDNAGGGLLGDCPDDGQCSWLRIAEHHPGGIQGCGDLLAVSSKGGAYVLQMGSAGDWKAARQNSVVGRSEATEAAGIAFHPVHNRLFMMTASGEALYASGCADMERCGFGEGTKVPRKEDSEELAGNDNTGGINLFFSESDKLMYVVGFQLEGSDLAGMNNLVVQQLRIERTSSDSVPWQRGTTFEYSLGKAKTVPVFPTSFSPLASFRFAGFAVVERQGNRIVLDALSSPRQVSSALGYILRRDRLEGAVP